MAKYSTIQQHEPLRVPSGWTGDKKRLIAQIEEILDDIYRRFGRLDMSDLSAKLRNRIEATDKYGESIANMELEIDRFAVELSKKASAEDVDTGFKSVEESFAALNLMLDAFRVELGKKATTEDVDAGLREVEEAFAKLELSLNSFSLELEKKVTSQDIETAIENITEFHNASVSITPETGIVMAVTAAIRAFVDEIETLTVDEMGVSADTVTVRKSLRAPNVVQKNMTGIIEWQGGVQASLDKADKSLTRPTVLTIPAGTYREDVTVQGFCGAELTLHFSKDATLNGAVLIRDCNRVTLEADQLGDGCIHPQTATDAVTLVGAESSTLKNMYFSGYRWRSNENNGSECAVRVNGGNCNIVNCGLEYSQYGARYENGASGFVQNVIGGIDGKAPFTNVNLLYGLYAANGAHVAANGTVPMGGTNATGSELATMLTGEITPTAGGMEYVPPAEVTKTFALSSNCTYRRGSDIRVGGQFTQGVYGSYASGIKWSTGAMWFAGATAELAGKTVTNAMLTLHRASGGSSSPRNVYLGTVALTEANYDSTNWPTFTPSASNYPGAQIPREGEMTYDVTELMGAVQQGYAIAVSEPIDDYGGSWSPHYAQFYGKGSEFEPVLAVTYLTGEPDVPDEPDEPETMTLMANGAFERGGDGTTTGDLRAYKSGSGYAVLSFPANAAFANVKKLTLHFYAVSSVSTFSTIALRSGTVENDAYGKSASISSPIPDFTPTGTGWQSVDITGGLDASGGVERTVIAENGLKIFLRSNGNTVIGGIGGENCPYVTIDSAASEPDTPAGDVSFVVGVDGSVTLSNVAFTQLSDGSVQIDNATFTQQDDESVLIQ